jgi:Xaa-Pro aminopeptidase
MKQVFTLLLLATLCTHAQPLQLDQDVFAQRREMFMEAMQPGSVAIFPSKPVYLRNLDVNYDYRQESNFYYLSGYEEPESILLFNPSHPEYRFVMFVRKRDPGRERYDGGRSGVEGAMREFRADTALYTDDFERSIFTFIYHDRPVYYTFGINPTVDDRIRRIMIEGRAGGIWPITDPAPIVNNMRLIKNDGDFRMGLKKAVDISAQAHIEAIAAIKPGMYEYEVQAVFEYVYRKNGSPRNGYPCIVGSGPNTGILHYSMNRRKMNDGDLVLMDCAAEYGYYSADITRTVPVNGKFSKEQREIYQLVLDAQNAAMSIVQPGVAKSSLDRAIDSVLGNGLVNLGFIKDKKDFKIFSLHGYSHWIGLEVHDVGGYIQDGKSRTLEAGMVFTIEPGIYVRDDVFERMKGVGYTDAEIASFQPRVEKYMHIGIRIEGDILVTTSGYENLSQGAPREIDAIERLMRNSRMAGNKSRN